MESGGLTNDLKSLYGVVVSPIMEAAFYVDLGARAISAVESMKNAGTWPAMEYTKCSEYNSASPVARSLDLVSAIQVIIEGNLLKSDYELLLCSHPLFQQCGER